MTAYPRTSNAVTILFLLLVGWHFGTVFGLFGTAPTDLTDTMLRLAVIVGGTVISAVIVSNIIMARSKSVMLPDEREEKIERVSEGVGVLAIYAGLLVFCWFAFTPLAPFQIVNWILAIVAVTEVIKLLTVLLLHKREDI